MKTDMRFKVQCSYFVENINLQLLADVELHNSLSHYFVTNIKFANRESIIPLSPAITIKAVLTDTGLKWMHTDSDEESVLSIVIGWEIEKTSCLEIY